MKTKTKKNMKSKTKKNMKSKSKSKTKSKTKTKKRNILAGVDLTTLPKDIMINKLISNLDSNELAKLIETSKNLNKLKEEPKIKSRLNKLKFFKKLETAENVHILNIRLEELKQIFKNMLNIINFKLADLTEPELNYEYLSDGSYREVSIEKNLNTEEQELVKELENEDEIVRKDMELLNNKNTTTNDINKIVLKYFLNLENIPDYEKLLEDQYEYGDIIENSVFVIILSDIKKQIFLSPLVYLHDGNNIERILEITEDDIDEIEDLYL